MSTDEKLMTVPTPALMRRTDGARRRVFDTVSSISSSSVAWHIRDVMTGEEDTVIRKRGQNEDVLGRVLEEVTQWVRARTDEPVMLRCFSPALRNAVLERLDPEEYSTPELITMSSQFEWASSVRLSLRELLGRDRIPTPKKRRIYAASDGSSHPRGGHAAFAWVTTDGNWMSAPASGDVLSAELSAIASFATFLARAKGCNEAVLFVDSLNAIDVIQGDRPIPSKGVRHEDIFSIRELVSRGVLEIVWVRGHQNHPLNILADRLALARYRARRSQLSSEQARVIGQRIVDECLPSLQGVSWGKLSVKSRRAHRRHLSSHSSTQ